MIIKQYTFCRIFGTGTLTSQEKNNIAHPSLLTVCTVQCTSSMSPVIYMVFVIALTMNHLK
jgi:hypothetical protein